jgi:hypothetical protein
MMIGRKLLYLAGWSFTVTAGATALQCDNLLVMMVGTFGAWLVAIVLTVLAFRTPRERVIAGLCGAPISIVAIVLCQVALMLVVPSCARSAYLNRGPQTSFRFLLWTFQPTGCIEGYTFEDLKRCGYRSSWFRYEVGVYEQNGSVVAQVEDR